MVKAVYPGTFDPITNGHLDIIKRSAKLFDQLDVVILHNANKKTLFNLDERLEMLHEVLKDFDNVCVAYSDDLTINYCHQVGAKVMIRGLRAVMDYEYELQIASANRFLSPDIETLFIFADSKFSFISSSTIKEIAGYKGDISKLVPSIVNQKLLKRYGRS